MAYTLAILRPQPTSTRLWQAGGLVAAIVLTVVVLNQLLPAEKSVGGEMLGHDFLAFYTAGTVVNNGNTGDLYSLSYANTFQHEIGRWFDLDLAEASFGPYWNPPFFALVFAPLAKMPYPYALATWTAINLFAAIGAVMLLSKMVAKAAHPWPTYESQSLGKFVQPWRYWLLVPLLVGVSMPFIQAISHGQNTFISLLILTATVVFWRNQKPLLAGFMCGLLFYKPQLAAIVAAMLTLTMGWRALAGIVFVGMNMLMVQELVLPGSTAMYLHQLPINLQVMQVDATYLWERHVTLKAFWRLLLQGREAGELSTMALSAWVGTTVLVAMGICMAVRNTWKTKLDDAFGGHTRAVQRDRLIAATIACMPLLMPFYFDYDLLLLAIPFTLLAVERLRRPDEMVHAHDRLITKIAAGMYLWLIINPGLAKDSGVNLTVLFLAAIAGLLLSRACRERVSPAVVEEEIKSVPQYNVHRALRKAA